MKIVNDYDNFYIYSPSLHQDLNQKVIKCFSNYSPIHLFPNILNEEDIDIVIDEKVNDKQFRKSDSEKDTHETIEELENILKNMMMEVLLF